MGAIQIQNKVLQIILEELCNIAGPRKLRHAFYVGNRALSETSLVLN
jgi:hypothetical protein